jgi:outer-membrane receptor for ferric coprogen and ferric-rhodotorulic acid
MANTGFAGASIWPPRRLLKNKWGNRKVRGGWLLCFCIIAIAWVPRAVATAGSNESVEYNLKIDSQPLGTALQELAKQCEVQIVFFSRVTEGLQAPALNARYTIAAALQILLSGSHLTFQVINPKTIEIRPLIATDPLSEASGRAGKGGKPTVRAGDTNAQPQKKTVDNSASLTELVVNGTAEGLVATRTETPLREIPQTISIVSQEQVRQENYVDLGDALADAIGITAQRTDSLSQTFYSRGFQITTFHLDGGAALNSFDLTTSPFLGAPDLSEFDHIEVLRGADGLFGGNGNPGATINLVRKRALTEPEVIFDASAGSWSNYRAEADVTGPLGFDGSLRGRLDIDFADQKYFYDTASLERGKLFAVLEYDLDPGTLITAGGSDERVDALPFVGGLPRYFNDLDPHLPRNTGLTFDWAKYDTQTREIYFQLAHEFSAIWKLKINATSWDQTANYDYGAFRSDNLPISNELPISPVYEYTPRPNTLNQVAFDTTLSGSADAFGHRLDVALGGDLLRFKGSTATVDSYNPVDWISNAYTYNPAIFPDPRLSQVPAEEDDSRVTSDQGAVFGSAKIHLSDALSIIAGARVSRDSATKNDLNRLGDTSSSGSHGFKTPTKTTPYTGVVYDLNQHYSLYSSFADIYQSNGILRENDGSFLPPIDGMNFEVGLKGAWHDGLLNGTLALYGIEQRGLPLDDVVADLTRSTYLYGCCYTSGGISRSKGVDFELNGKLAPGWLIGAGYTYNINYGIGAENLANETPRHLFKLWTSKQLVGGLQRWTVGGNVQAQSSSSYDYYSCPFDATANCIGPYALFKTEQGSYAIVGLRAGYTIDPHWRVALNVNNIFNRIYYQNLGNNLGGNWYGEPRNFLVRIDARY